MTEQESIERGRAAREVLASPIYQEAVMQAEASIIADWKRCVDAEARERLWASLQGLGRISHVLEAFQSSGEMAAHILKSSQT